MAELCLGAPLIEGQREAPGARWQSCLNPLQCCQQRRLPSLCRFEGSELLLLLLPGVGTFFIYFYFLMPGDALAG